MQTRDRFEWSRIQRAVERGAHVGIHNHVFRSSTVIDRVLRPLQQMRLIPFRTEEFVPARAETGGEMIIVLRKAMPEAEEVPADAFYVQDHEPGDGEAAPARVEEEARLRCENETLTLHVADLQRRIAAMQASRSWRVTAPLRGMAAWLR